MRIEKTPRNTREDERRSQVSDVFGARSYQTLVKQEVVTAPGISQEQRLIAAVNNIKKTRIK